MSTARKRSATTHLSPASSRRRAISGGAVSAMQRLAAGMLAHPRNTSLRTALANGELTESAWLRQLCLVVYRILFITLAEDRGALPGRDAHAGDVRRYWRSHSVRHMRSMARLARPAGPVRNHSLYQNFSGLCRSLAGHDELLLRVPRLGGPLWSPAAVEHVAPAALDDSVWLSALADLQLVGAGDDAPAATLAHVNPEMLGEIHEKLLTASLCVDPADWTVQVSIRRGNRRRESASFYTPDGLVHALLDHSLMRMVRDRTSAVEGTDSVINQLHALRIFDPACGAGHCLLPVARRLARHAASISQGRGGGGAQLTVPDDAHGVDHIPFSCMSTSDGEIACTYCQTLLHVVRHGLFGMDTDPVAIELCKAALWLEAGRADLPLSDWDARIRCADTLVAMDAAYPPDGMPAAFDLVVGNPPFVNAIEGGVSVESRALIRRRFPLLGGTADYSAAFLALAVTLVSPAGRVAFVMPRQALSAASLRQWKSSLPCHARPTMLFAFNRANLFPGAAVYIALVVLGSDAYCDTAIGDDPARAKWKPVQIRSDNWWSLMTANKSHAAPRPSAAHDRRIADDFEVVASMAAGDAYDLVPSLRDQFDGGGCKLVTTGLIGVGECHWGQSRCLYLKRRYLHPRIDDADPSLTASLRRRLARARRPKIIVAGLSRRIECFVDAAGEYAGAVSTFSIHHPTDDCSALRDLADELLSHRASEQFRIELGGNAMGGGNTTMTRGFLEQYVWQQLPPAGLNSNGGSRG